MSIYNSVFNFTNYSELIFLMRHSLYIALILGIVGGVIGVFIQIRQAAFAVHGIAELSFSGAALALLLNWNVILGSIVGSIVGSILIAILDNNYKAKINKDQSIIGVVMSTGLGLGIIFLSLCKTRSANKFGLLTGQIVAIDNNQLSAMIVMASIVLSILFIIGRPLFFASLDEKVAKVHGVPTKILNFIFMLILGISTAMSVHIVGALLVLSLLITPAVSASQISRSPKEIFFFSVLFSVFSSVGGVLLALGGHIPVSPYITCISFFIFFVCKIINYYKQI